MRHLLPVLFVACVFVAGSASAGMLKYTDSQGRLRFVQDISQVPPEYRNQVEKQKLGRDISVTGSGGSAQSQQQRIKAMEKRSQQLGNATRRNRPKVAPAKRKHHLEGAPAPRKYNETDCWWDNGTRRCKRTLTGAWQAWNQANGGNNGKAVTRRKIGK